MNYTLIGVAAFLAVALVLGYWRGFVRMVLVSLVTLAAIALTMFLSPITTDFFRQSTPLYDAVYEDMEEIIEEEAERKIKELTGWELPDSVKVLNGLDYEYQKTILEDLPIPNLLKQGIEKNNNEETYQKLGVAQFSDYISAYVAATVVKVVAVVSTFLVLYLALRIVVTALNLMTMLPGLHLINSLAGMLAGLAVAMIFVWAFFLTATVLSTGEFGAQVLSDVADSQFLTVLYDMNPFLSYITNLAA